MEWREQGKKQRARLQLADIVALPIEEVPKNKQAAPSMATFEFNLPDIDLPSEQAPATAPLPVLVEAGDIAVSTAKFDRLTDKALDTLEDCMDERNDDQDHVRLMNLKMQAAQTIISSRIKVDDTLLRKQQFDILPKIIELMAAEEENLRQIEAEAE